MKTNIKLIAAISALVITFILPSARAQQSRIVLPGHRSGVMARIAPVGYLDESTNLHLSIGLALRNQDDLQERLRQMHDPANPHFRHYLTRDEFVAQYAPSQAQYDAAIAYATAHGLTVTTTYTNRLLFDVTGSVANIEKVFHVRMRWYPHPTEKRLYYAPDRDPSIDPQFQILDVSGLDNFSLPHPLDLKMQPLTNNVQSNAISGSGPEGLLIGNDFRNVYAPGVTLNGYGQSLALVELGQYYSQNITVYEEYAGLGNINITNVSVDGFDMTPTTNMDDAEEAIDIEMAMSMAPAATIMVYEGGDVYDVLNQIASDDVARQIGCSWGNYPAPASFYNTLEELSAQGQTAFVAAGDHGAYVNNTDAAGNDFIFAPIGYPNVVMVGGTGLSLTGQGGQWQSETTWSGSGGGWDTNFAIPSYQQGVSMATNGGSTTFRNFPDVAAVAETIFPVNGDTNSLGDIGGTSCSAPLWAGFMALVNEQAADNDNPPVDMLPSIYAIGEGSQYTNAFHDITVGNNTNSISPNAFFAVPGYDLCTGWGSPNGTNLINLLAATTDTLQISPGFGFAATVPYGASAANTNIQFTLTNSSGAAFSWTAGSTSLWLEVESSGGALSAHTSAVDAVALVPGEVAALPVGTYESTVTFSNAATGATQSRLFVLNVSAAAQPLALTGFNASVVVPTNGTLAEPEATAFDILDDLCFYQTGLPGTTQGLPVNGRFVSAADGQTVFQLGPYGADNVLLLGRNYAASGTLTLASPASLNSLAILATSAVGQPTSTGTLVLNFTDGSSSQSFSFNALDMLTSSTVAALQGTGRLYLGNFSIQNNGNLPALYQTTIPLAELGITQAIASITFTMPSDATNTGIFAVSGVSGALSDLAPVITQQPQPVNNTNIYIDVAFSVSVSGAPPFSYQWYSNSVPLPYANAPTLSFGPDAPTNDTATYFVVVSNMFGVVQSTPANLTIYRLPPQFSQEPALTDYTVLPGDTITSSGAPTNLVIDVQAINTGLGDTITLSATATNLFPVSYSWELNGAAIPGATNNTLVLTNLQPADAGDYVLVASSITGQADSDTVTLNVARPLLAYWPLNETSGTTAYDYANGNNGVYTNAVLGQPGYFTNLAAEFGETSSVNSYVSIPTIDFWAANLQVVDFTVSAWVKASTNINTDAGIVTKGYSGDEEFCLDCGGPNYAFRFFMRGLYGGATVATSSVAPDGQWHYLVGVCDEPNAAVTLYVDGTNAAQSFISPSASLNESTVPASIGSRESGDGTPYDYQFIGEIENVVLYAEALSATQVQTLYAAGEVLPAIALQPLANWEVYIGASATNEALATGSGALGYQWYGPQGAIAGATSSNLVLNDVQPSQLGNYYVIVTNAYGSAQSENANLNDTEEWPVIEQQPSTPWVGYPGSSATNTVVAQGVGALSYQWYGPQGAIADATSSNLVLNDIQSSEQGNYYVVVTDPYGSAQSENAFLDVGVATTPGAYGQYFKEFSSYTNGTTSFNDGSQLFSTALGTVAGVQGESGGSPGELALTEYGVTNVRSAFLLPALNPDAPVYAFSVKWNSQQYGNFTEGVDTAGDGFSFNYGQLGSLNLVGTNYNQESGYGVGLCLSVQADEGNNPGFYLRVNGNTVASAAYDPYSEWGNYNLARHFFEVDWNDTNGMSFYLDHTAIFTNVPTPGFVPAAGDRFAWGARSGAVSEETRLDNVAAVTGGNLVQVQTGAPYFGSANTDPDNPPFDAFNGIYYNGNNYWTTANQTSIGYVGATVFPPAYVAAYAVTTAPFGNPKTWTLDGSDDDGTNWTTGASTTGYFLNNYETRAWLATNATPFSAYRLNITAVTAFDAVGQLQFYEFVPVTGSSASTPVGFNSSGADWSTNQSSTYTSSVISNNVLTLTDGSATSQARSAFFDAPQYIGAFQASFTYQATGDAAADGVAFVLQNDPRGASALGESGGDLGVGGTNAIIPSAELELNLYTGHDENKGYTFLTNGLTGADGDNGNYQSLGNVNLSSGDPIGVTLNYTNGQLALTFTDAVAAVSFSTNLDVGNLTNIVGGATAYVGFTGGDGSATSIQTITDFSFVSIPPPAPVNVGFNGSGANWSTNQSGTYTSSVISNNVLTLTDSSSTSQARSAFFDTPQYIGAFQSSFTYQATGDADADGAAFVLQNDPRGASALGESGGSLGVGGTNAIIPSAELELNLYTGHDENKGYTFLTNGLTGADGDNGNYQSLGNVNLSSGDPIGVTLNYADGQLALTFTDAVAAVSFSTNLDVGNLTNIVGGATAYVGFTGGDGSATSIQTITDFSFVSILPPAPANVGFNAGENWSANQSGAYTSSVISNNVLTLTDGGENQARGAFFGTPQYIGAFQSSFTYQATGNAAADGAAFVLQNDPRGAFALGESGGDLGVGGTNAIIPSAALELNLYTGGNENKGYTFLTNGLTGADGDNGNYHSLGNVNLSSGDPIGVTLNYADGQLALTFTDAVAAVSFSTNLDVGNLTNIVGGATAYVGFTGGDGSETSIQTITDFSFVSIPPETINVSGNNVAISWPASVTGYTLQENSNLASANWVTVTNQPTVINGQNQVIVPLTTSNAFYRLILQ